VFEELEHYVIGWQPMQQFTAARLNGLGPAETPDEGTSKSIRSSYDVCRGVDDGGVGLLFDMQH
jgi:hypothetical protein